MGEIHPEVPSMLVQRPVENVQVVASEEERGVADGFEDPVRCAGPAAPVGAIGHAGRRQTDELVGFREHDLDGYLETTAQGLDPPDHLVLEADRPAARVLSIEPEPAQEQQDPGEDLLLSLLLRLVTQPELPQVDQQGHAGQVPAHQAEELDVDRSDLLRTPHLGIKQAKVFARGIDEDDLAAAGFDGVTLDRALRRSDDHAVLDGEAIEEGVLAVGPEQLSLAHPPDPRDEEDLVALLDVLLELELALFEDRRLRGRRRRPLGISRDLGSRGRGGRRIAPGRRRGQWNHLGAVSRFGLASPAWGLRRLGLLALGERVRGAVTPGAGGLGDLFLAIRAVVAHPRSVSFFRHWHRSSESPGSG